MEFCRDIKINLEGINFKTLSGTRGNINTQKLKWAISPKKNISDKFNIGDIIFVKEQQLGVLNNILK